MRSRTWRLITVGAALLGLLVPAAAASGADQTVEVTVLPAGTLAIEVEYDFGMGVVVPGATTGERPFMMNITNTTDTGWEVWVEGTDFASFDRNCDESGCWREPNGMYTMPATAIYLRGGDLQWWETDVIVPYEGYLAGAATPFLLMESGPEAYGQFGVNEPEPAVSVTVPGDAAIAEYYTTLTYTIQAPTP